MTFMFRLLGVGLSLATKYAGVKLVDLIWQKSTGNAPPKDTDGLENTLRAALIFALVSGAVSTIIQVLTNRTTQRAINRFTNSRELT